jgi:phage tail-like protein
MVNYPLVDFSFTVEFGLLPQMPVDSQFLVVSGLITTAEARQPSTVSTPSTTPVGAATGELAPPNKSPFTTVYSPLVLRRGLPLISAVSAWCIDAFENNNYVPVNLKVILWDEQQTPVCTWYIKNALPVKRELSDLNAQGSSLLIETITLNYGSLKTISESAGLITKNLVKVIPNF